MRKYFLDEDQAESQNIENKCEWHIAINFPLISPWLWRKNNFIRTVALLEDSAEFSENWSGKKGDNVWINEKDKKNNSIQWSLTIT